MGMHPKFDEKEFFFFYDLFFSENRDAAINKLVQLELIRDDQVPRWLEFFSKLNKNSPAWANTVDHFKISLDKIIEDNSFLSTTSPLGILNNIIRGTAIFGTDIKNIDNVRGKVILDYGSGVYRPFNTAIILYCNGFDATYAYEPFPVKNDFVSSSLHHLIRSLTNNPADYIFTGISVDEFISRLKTFIIPNLDQKIHEFSSGITNKLRIGGVTLVSDLEIIPDDSIDYHFSNAVLEHVDDINKYLGILRRKVKKDSRGCHVVDFCDHRYYDDNTLSPMEKYYDGVLDEINGLTPSELEHQIVRSGWNLLKYNSQKIPEIFLSSESRARIGKYADAPVEELLEHINFYSLTLV